jgi:hypothetical protein
MPSWILFVMAWMVHSRAVTVVAWPSDSRWITSALFREPLVEWLDRLQVRVPDQSFSAKWINLDIRNLTCTHFVIQTVESSYIPSNFGMDHPATVESSSPPMLQLMVHQIAASCQGLYHSSGAAGASGNLFAQLSAAAAAADTALPFASMSSAALEWSMAIEDKTQTASSQPQRQPRAVSTQQCQSHVAVSELHFTGSFSAQLLDWFATPIKHAVNDAVQAHLCPTLISTVDPLASNYLNATMTWLQPYLSTPSVVSSVSSATVQEATVDEAQVSSSNDTVPTPMPLNWWTDAPVLVHSLAAINDWVSHHLHRGWVPWLAPSCGGLAYSVNEALRALLHGNRNDSSWTVVPPTPLHVVHMVLPRYAALDVTLHQISVSGDGWSDWTNLTVLRPVMDRNIQWHSELVTDGPQLAIVLDVTLQVSTVPGGMFQGDDLVESFQVQIEMERLAAAFDLSVDLDEALFQVVTVETLWSAWNRLWAKTDHDATTPQEACLLESVQNISLSSLTVHTVVSKVAVFPMDPLSMSSTAGAASSSYLRQEPTINHELEHDIDALINNAVQLILTEYQPLVTDAIHGLTMGLVQNKVNQWLDRVIHSTPPTNNCTVEPHDNEPSQPDSGDTLPHWLNFSMVPLLQHLNAFLNEPHTLSVVNRYLECVGDDAVATTRHGLVATDPWAAAVLAVPQPIASTWRWNDLVVANIGSLQELRFLLPSEDGMHLQSAWHYGSDQTTTVDTLRPQVIASVAMGPSDAFNFSAVINTTIYLDDVDWDAWSILHFDTRRFMKATVLHLLSNGHCPLVPVDEFDLYSLVSHLGYFRVVLNVSAGGEGNTFEFSIDSLGYKDVQDSIDSIADWTAATVRDMLQTAAKVTLANSKATCSREAREIVPDNSTPSPSGPAISTSSILLILAAIFIFAQPAFLLMRRPKGQGVEEDESLDLREPLLNPNNTRDRLQASMEERGSSTAEPDSLMFHSSVPTATRYLVPISILVVIVVLMASNLSVGATVDTVVSVQGRAFRLPPLFGFSLINTARDMFQARIYPLWFLVVGFSGVWPYAKLVMMLVMWTSPKHALCTQRRGRLLLRLDALSKFSLVDTYVLVGK